MRVSASAVSASHTIRAHRCMCRPMNGCSGCLPTCLGISLTGDAAANADLVIAAIRRGHVYTAIDGLHGTGTLSFTATDGSTRAEPGDVVSSLREWTLNIELGGPADALIQLFRDGVRTNEASMRLKHMIDIGSRGAYRVEVSLPGAPGQPPIPWLLSNPIYVGDRPTPATSARSRALRHSTCDTAMVLRQDGRLQRVRHQRPRSTSSRWNVAHSSRSDMPSAAPRPKAPSRRSCWPLAHRLRNTTASSSRRAPIGQRECPFSCTSLAPLTANAGTDRSSSTPSRKRSRSFSTTFARSEPRDHNLCLQQSIQSSSCSTR